MQFSMSSLTRRCIASASLISAGLAVSAIGQVSAEPTLPPAVVTHLPVVLTLKDAIAIALHEQPQTTIAKGSVDSALGLRQEDKSQYYPTITPSYTFERNRSIQYGITQNQFSTSSINPVTQQQSSTVVTTPGDAINTIQGGGATINLKQTIFDSGQRELTNAEGRHEVESASLRDEDTREQIIATVTTAFYNLLAAEDQVKVAQANVTENQQTVALTQAELTAGTAAQTDVYQAKANLATAQVTLIQDQNAIEVDAAALKNAIGVVTEDPVQPESLESGNSLPSVPTPAAIATQQQFEQIAQQNRNDLKAQLAVVETDRDAVKLARINAGLSLSADYLLTYQPTNDIGPRGTASAVTLTGSLPLFDGGYTHGAVRVADSSLETALATFEQTRQTILEAVDQDYATRQESLQAITYAQAAVQAGQINYDAAVASREAQVGTVLQITTAEATLTQAQSQYVSAIYNYYIADSNLQRAAGLD